MMNWNFHSYYVDTNTGLISKLVLNSSQEKKLKALRELVRHRITKVFKEATSIAQDSIIENNIFYKLQNTEIKYLSKQEQLTVAKLIQEMDDETRKEFIDLKPRFWTQGSFKYKTLNKPYNLGQEMDIDDGTYLPMDLFESEPKIAHHLLILLVDSALKSLVAANNTWKFEAKRTCARIKISQEQIHIDVPMYAIPKEQFIEKELSLTKSSMKILDEETLSNNAFSDAQYDKIDTEYVNLALRDTAANSPKWMNSDPKVVEDWFNKSCLRIGTHLRKVCRFMKAWRDAQWDVGGPSSICLMAATVEVLDKVSHNSEDMNSIMRTLALNLPNEFIKGIASPDEKDEKLLFPPLSQHTKRETEIVNKLKLLITILDEAEISPNKKLALKTINKAFGNRVNNELLIKTSAAAPAFKHDAIKSNKPTAINPTMISG